MNNESFKEEDLIKEQLKNQTKQKKRTDAILKHSSYKPMVLSATDQNTKFLILADVRVDVPTVRTSVRVGCRTPPLLQRPRLSRFTMDL